MIVNNSTRVTPREVYNFLKQFGWKLKRLLTLHDKKWRDCVFGEEGERWIMLLTKGNNSCYLQLQVFEDLRSILSLKVEVWKYIEELGWGTKNENNNDNEPFFYLSDLDLLVEINNIITDYNQVETFQKRAEKLLSVIYEDLRKLGLGGDTNGR